MRVYATNQTINCRGWTLLELMITLLVMAILAAIAYPSYTSHLIKSRRADGKALLYEAAQKEQQFFTSNYAFTATAGSGGLGMSTASLEGHYTLSIAATATTYTLTATRVGSQTDDGYCGDLTLNHLGARGISGGTWTADKCW
jgi:type IV pilus assembly protein PilE